jgi:hypothetical protein
MSKESFIEFKIAGAFTAAGIAITAGGYIDNKLNATSERINQAYDKARNEVAAENITRPARKDEENTAAIINEARDKLSILSHEDINGVSAVVEKLPNALKIEAQERNYNKAFSDHAAKYIDQGLRRHEFVDTGAHALGGVLTASGLALGTMATLARLVNRRRPIPQTPQGK